MAATNLEQVLAQAGYPVHMHRHSRLGAYAYPLTAIVSPVPYSRVARETYAEGYSLEMTAGDIDALRAAAPAMPAETPVAITFLPGEDPATRIAAYVRSGALTA